MICLSQGTAACLGLKKTRMAAAPTTAYLLFGEHCLMDCAFCPQARGNRDRGNGGKTGGGGNGRDKNGTTKLLGRVTWPAFSRQELLESLQGAVACGLRRICIQGVKSKDGHQELLQFIARVKEEASSLPLCVSTWVDSEEDVALFMQAGVERVSIALDVVNAEAYRRFKKGSLQQRCRLLFNCAHQWPGHLGTHIIVGLGETEEEIIALMGKLLDTAVSVALFAFTPLRGTVLATHPPPLLKSYRRIQAARFLLQTGVVTPAEMRFRDGRLHSLGLTKEQLQYYLRGGEAFQTSGCPDCNRPYYNERPGGVIYNYPRPLTPEEEKGAIQSVVNNIEEA